ncbi:MAG: hypothetical protein P9L97_07850 [Candidatus Tenebribacter davisii]|nr:hypothetical protein [Candidatus Tenebribacter davisii]
MNRVSPWTTDDLRPLWSSQPRSQNAYVWFRASLNIKKKLIDVEFKLISTVPYQLFCNGSLCGWGPWRSTQKVLWLTSHNLSSQLRPGKNELWLLMHDPAVPSAYRDSVAPWWMGEIVARYSGNKVRLLASDEKFWLCAHDPNWEKGVLQSIYLRNFCEHYQMTAKEHVFPSSHPISDWEKPNSYTKDTLKNKEIGIAHGAPPLGGLIQPTKYKITSFNRVPYYQKETCDNYYRGLWRSWQLRNGAWHRGWIDGQQVTPFIRYIPPDGKKIEFSGSKTWHPQEESLYLKGERFNKSHIAVLYDFEKQVSGIWYLEITAKTSATIHILHGERLFPEENLNHGIADSDCVKIVPGKTQWTGFQQRGTRYVVLVVENASGVDAINFGVISTAYNKPVSADINCRDRFLHSALKACAETVSLCSSDGFMDCPWRERCQWTGDSLLSAEVLADLFNDPEPWRRLLLSIVSASNPGEILPAVIPGAHIDRIPFYDFMAVLSAGRYTEHYEGKIPPWLVPFLRERIRTFYNYMTPGGLLENVPGRNFQGWNFEHASTPVSTYSMRKWIQNGFPSSKGCYDFLDRRTRGINAVTNAYWLRILEASGNIVNKAGNSNLASEFKLLHRKGAKSFMELLWDETRGLVHERMPLLGGKFPPSELPNCAAMSAGLLSQKQAKRVIDSRWNRRKKMVRILGPYGAKLVIEGLLRYGRSDLAYQYLKCVYSPMLAEGNTSTLWESFIAFGGETSKVQGVAAYPIWLYWKARHK